ncbi:hypothetical protein [Nocardia carnea]|uniref:Uncharacterized protein n=1 Tax=Nocardia carnea TaxID=37328 RepID=A0ABW7TH17_9NOCA|nr:hypothetical protein [Nocardia carnea]
MAEFSEIPVNVYAAEVGLGWRSADPGAWLKSSTDWLYRTRRFTR